MIKYAGESTCSALDDSVAIKMKSPLTTTVTLEDSATCQPSEKTFLLPKSQPTEAPPSSWHTYSKGFTFIALATTAYALVSILVRVAETRFNYPPLASVFVRGLIITLVSSVLTVTKHGLRSLWRDLTPRQKALLALRGSSGALAVCAQYTAFMFLPAGQVIALFATTPLFALVVARFTLREPATALDGVCALVGIVGVGLISDLHGSGGSGSGTVIGVVLAVASAALSGVSYTAVRAMGLDVPPALSVMSLSVGSVVLTGGVGIGAGALGVDAGVLAGGVGCAVILVASLFSVLAQLGLNHGLQRCPAGAGSVVANLDVPLVYILGTVFLGERCTSVQATGSVLVVISALGIVVQRLL